MVPRAYLLLPILTLSSPAHSFNAPNRAAVATKPPSTVLFDYRTKWSPKGGSPSTPSYDSSPASGGTSPPPSGKYSRTKWSPGKASSASPVGGFTPGGGADTAAVAEAVGATGRQPWEDTNVSFSPGKYARTKWSPRAVVSATPVGGFTPGGSGGATASGGAAPGKYSRTKWSPGTAVSASPLGGHAPGGGAAVPAAAATSAAAGGSGRQPWEDTNTRKVVAKKSYARTKWSPGAAASSSPVGGFAPAAGSGVASASAAPSPPGNYARTKWSPGKAR